MAKFTIIKGEGKRVNLETGVEIVKVPAQRIGRNGWRVAGYEIRFPSRDGGFDQPSFEPTFREAKDAADERAEMIREVIAEAYDEALAEADRIEQADADAVPAVEAVEGLLVRFRSTFSPDLVGIEFRIASAVRVAAESAGGYAFVTLQAFVKADTRSGLRAVYRLGNLDDLRTLDGGRVVAAASKAAADEDAAEMAAHAEAMETLRSIPTFNRPQAVTDMLVGAELITDAVAHLAVVKAAKSLSEAFEMLNGTDPNRRYPTRKPLPVKTLRHGDVVTFAPDATSAPSITAGTEKAPWKIDGTGAPEEAPGGRVYVYVWQSFIHPTKGRATRAASVWLDELRTEDGTARVTLPGYPS